MRACSENYKQAECSFFLVSSLSLAGERRCPSKEKTNIANHPNVKIFPNYILFALLPRLFPLWFLAFRLCTFVVIVAVVVSSNFSRVVQLLSDDKCSDRENEHKNLCKIHKHRDCTAAATAMVVAAIRNRHCWLFSRSRRCSSSWHFIFIWCCVSVMIFRRKNSKNCVMTDW